MNFNRPAWINRVLAGVALATLFLATSGIFSTPALADLMVTPKRVILAKGVRSATLHLFNDSNEVRTYELSWKQMRMDNHGGLKEDMDPVAAGNASSLIIVNPKRVVLGPGESQTVRLRARLPVELPFGEYISHLSFSPIVQPLREESGEDVEGAQMQLTVLLGIAIPVIVRHGELSATAVVQITGIDIERNVISVDLARQGTSSILGNLEGYWGQPGQPGTLIAQLNNVAVYPNVDGISRDIPLNLPAGFQFRPGLLHMIYRDPQTLRVLTQATVRVE